jgi:hypothetical protein
LQLTCTVVRTPRKSRSAESQISLPVGRSDIDAGSCRMTKTRGIYFSVDRSAQRNTFSRRQLRPSFAISRPSKKEGAGNAGRLGAPAAPRAK